MACQDHASTLMVDLAKSPAEADPASLPRPFNCHGYHISKRPLSRFCTSPLLEMLLIIRFISKNKKKPPCAWTRGLYYCGQYDQPKPYRPTLRL
jgi:hypothetical protein